MALSYSKRTFLTKIGVITLAYVLIGLFKGYYDYVMITSVDEGSSWQALLPNRLLFNALGGFFGGIFGGSALLYFMNDRFQKLSFGWSLVFNAGLVILMVFVISLLVSVIGNSLSAGRSVFDPVVWSAVMDFVPSPIMVSNLAYWSLVVFLTQFILQVNDKFGQGVLVNLLRGKYHRPKEEERIFMFLDLKSSTTIAERLGNVAYFSLLNDFFFDITDPVLKHRGEIYQYVGDEVVISWKVPDGLHQANCVACFFRAEDRIREIGKKYAEKFGLVPEFKAGIHVGPVTVGEIGLIKKDIAYSGDVLNTTARIQELCNRYEARLLISGELLRRLSLDGHYQSYSVGELNLRGKKEKIMVYKIERKDEHVPITP